MRSRRLRKIEGRQLPCGSLRGRAVEALPAGAQGCCAEASRWQGDGGRWGGLLVAVRRRIAREPGDDVSLAAIRAPVRCAAFYRHPDSRMARPGR
ncbi:hypothetical protein XFF6992_370183 [Xanthomonas citri pv. fuscans]|nr:hypothetical protein XFF6992_370183 [Xanthomonas citri pv. fuscans]SOO33906.1 hypothetical protein XFF6994_3290009 [Xanthomonas citri pv. fuscans]